MLIRNTETLSTKVSPELWDAFKQKAMDQHFTNTAECLRQLVSDFVYGHTVAELAQRSYELTKGMFGLIADEKLGPDEYQTLLQQIEGQ